MMRPAETSPQRVGDRPLRGRRGVRWLLITMVVLGIAIATAMVPWWPIYSSAALVVLVIVATAVGFGIAALAAYRRWPAWLLILVTFGAFLALGVPLAVPGRALWGVLPTGEGLAELLAGTVLGWKQLVTIVVPVGSYQSLLVPALVVVLGSSVVSLTLALRVRAAEFAIVPSLAVFIAGIILGPLHSPVSIESGLAMLLVSIAWIVAVRMVRRADMHVHSAIGRPVDRGAAAGRRILGSAVLIAFALATGAAVALAVPPSGEREVVRAYVQQPFDPRDFPSPLAGFRSYLRAPMVDQPLLEVSGLAPGDRLRIATLDTYDGVVYSVGSEAVTSASGAFTRLPYRLDQSSIDGTARMLDVAVLGYRGVWVPGVGHLEQVQFSGSRAEQLANEFAYNDVTGTAAVLGGLTEGDGYRSWSMVVRPVEDLATVRPGTSVLPETGPLPEGLEVLLDRYAPASDTPGARLAGMLAGLKREGYVSHGVGNDEPFTRSGHAADRLTQLATDRPMLGDDEQYAVTAALLAREIGFPARVVMGFRPPETAEDSVVLTGGDVAAWVEVQISDGRWVGLDPNPEIRPIPDREPEEPTIISRPQSVLPPPAEQTPVDQVDREPEHVPDDDEDALPIWVQILVNVLVGAGWAVLALAIVLSPFVAIIAAKWNRRRVRRTVSEPDGRVASGWREFADTAVDFGYEIPARATRSELASVVGGLDSHVLASIVNRSLYAPQGPSTEDADLVWSSVENLTQRMKAVRSLRQRLRAAISLRSFGRYAVRRKGNQS